MVRTLLRRFAVAVVAGTLSVGVVTTTAAAQPRAVPEKYRMAQIDQGTTPTVKVDKKAFIAGAKRAGQPLTATAQREIAAAAVSCWAWDAWKTGKSLVGLTLWKSHHRVNWCGDGSWIRSHAYTERWGETFAPGWNDKGIEQQGSRYGVNWNQFNSWTQHKFCFVSYFSCIQEAHPYHNTTVWPNGAGQWN
jgi:hypothetical protein